MSPAELVQACRCPEFAEQERTAGTWTLRQSVVSFMNGYRRGSGLKPGWRFTILWRMTEAKLHRPPGDVVMEDSPLELRRHLPILMAARGRVLITGLGLGCVVRGLLAKPEVDHVDVVELDPTILEWIGPEFQDDPRVTLHQGDALTYDWPSSTRWDFAWHDVWVEDGTLDLVHVEMMRRYSDMVPRQGAWGLDRTVKLVMQRRLPGFLSGRRVA